MNAFFFLCGTIVIFFSAIFNTNAQISLQVVTTSSSTSSRTSWSTSWGSHETSKTSTKRIEATISNLSTNSLKLRIATYLFAKPRGQSNAQRVIYGIQQTFSEMKAGTRTNLVFVLAPVKSEERDYKALGEQYFEGYQSEGWSVAVFQVDKLLASYASTPFLQSLTQDSEILPNLISQWKNRQVASGTPELFLQGF